MLDLLYQRRSIRKYQDRVVEEEKIQQLVKAVLLAPSSKNIHLQRFIVVTDKDLLEKLAQTRKSGSSFIKGAPLAIVVAGDTSLNDVWVEDATVSATILMLAAKAIGLDSCWVQVRERDHDEQKTADQYLKEVLSIPPQVSVDCIISIGYAQEAMPARTDEDLDFSRVFYNGYNA